MAIQPLDREARPAISLRRLKYAMDASYRAKAKDISRNAYRRKTGMETDSCLYSLQFLGKMAKLYPVMRENEPHKVRTISGFNVPLAADALQQLYQTVWRWVQNGIIPKPVFVRVGYPGKRPYYIYHLEEVRIFIEEIGEHEKTMAYLRKDHLEVRGRIEQRILKFRHTLKF